MNSVLVAVLMSIWAIPAAADLYRWVDPETGSIKFSSYPPPWFGDPARERRAPKVEVIPDRSRAPSSGAKPADEARPEPRPEPRPAARPLDQTPDGPADKTSGKAASKPEPAAMKQKPGDGR